MASEPPPPPPQAVTSSRGAPSAVQERTGYRIISSFIRQLIAYRRDAPDGAKVPDDKQFDDLRIGFGH
jgi:hypothetical protein